MKKQVANGIRQLIQNTHPVEGEDEPDRFKINLQPFTPRFMPFSFQQLLIWLPVVTETGAAITGIVRYRQLKPPLRYLLLLVVLALATDLYYHLLWHQKANNLSIIPPYILIEFGLLAIIYRYELKARWIKRGIIAVLVAFTAFVSFRWASGATIGFLPVERFTEGVLVLLFVLLYFYQTLKKLTAQHLERTPMFWLSAGLFVFFACDNIIFIFSNYILASYSRQFNMQIWIAHAILTTVLYVFYTLALWISPKSYNLNS